MLVHVGCTAQMILMDPWLLCQFRRRFLNITFDENKTQQKNIPSGELTYLGLSPLPVIVEMKVYRDSLLNM